MATYTDSAIIESKTSLADESGVEVPSFETAVIESKTSFTGSWTETYVITTHDYNHNPLTATYNFNPAIPTFGSVGVNDSDNGRL